MEPGGVVPAGLMVVPRGFVVPTGWMLEPGGIVPAGAVLAPAVGGGPLPGPRGRPSGPMLVTGAFAGKPAGWFAAVVGLCG